ncbi:MAG: hypothetical protein LBJ14_01055 [Desulfarculales bacterium]|jgi:predicted amidohydrolase|nr:hypothetical protein [Desulfarculales bacterium]
MKVFMLAAVVQTLASADRESNLKRVAGQVEEAARLGARLAVLPEYFAFLRLRGQDPVPAEPLRGPTYEYLASLARDHDLWLVGGSFYQQGPEGKAYNTSLLIDNKGGLVDCYQKIHLASANRHQGVQNAFDESRDLHYGRRLWVRPTVAGALGVIICYDLRFPEITRALRMQGAEIIAAPCAFFIAGGRTHWDAIIRSRAIENQCYMLAAGQWGEYAPGRRAFGCSMIVDPAGRVLAQAGDGPAVLCADIDIGRLEQNRKVMDYFSQARLLPGSYPVKG